MSPARSIPIVDIQTSKVAKSGVMRLESKNLTNGYLGKRVRDLGWRHEFGFHQCIETMIRDGVSQISMKLKTRKELKTSLWGTLPCKSSAGETENLGASEVGCSFY